MVQRSDDEQGPALTPEDLQIEPDAPAETVAAIAAALQAHRASAADVETDDPESPGWRGRAWSFAGRYELTTGRAVRPSDPLPTDPWRTAGRLDGRSGNR